MALQAQMQEKSLPWERPAKLVARRAGMQSVHVQAPQHTAACMSTAPRCTSTQKAVPSEPHLTSLDLLASSWHALCSGLRGAYLVVYLSGTGSLC